MTTIDIPTLTRTDFVSNQEVRWCPGCGDYAILAQMQKILPEIGVAKENIVFISGIGCSSRFPYYMNTYGIHSIHGRAPTLASGLKVANPDLSVWVITGDGDALSIGGNHLIHALRRNIDINIILFNNRIYGLTKGQYSPTSMQGTKTKSSPLGSLEQPLNPISVAIASEATFIARSVDVHTQHLQDILKQAAEHKGTAFVEIFQNCLIFNDGAWEHVTDRKIRDENILSLEHGKPMVFGKNLDKGIRMNGIIPEVVSLGNGFSEADLLVHDQESNSTHLAYMLSRMQPPNFPTPMGVFRKVERSTYEQGLMHQVEEAIAQRGKGDLKKLFHSADTWVVTSSSSQSHMANQDTELHTLDEAYVDDIEKPLVEPSYSAHSLATDPLSELQPHVPISLGPDATLDEVVVTMRANNIGSILIVDQDGKLAGVFTEHDLLKKAACEIQDLTTVRVRDYMTPNPTALTADAPIAHALHLMSIHGFRHLPIVDSQGRPIGIISFRDVVAFIEHTVMGN